MRPVKIQRAVSGCYDRLRKLDSGRWVRGSHSVDAVSVDPDFGSPEKLERNTMQIGQTNENEMDRQTCTGYERGSSTVARMVMKILCSISVLVSALSPGAMEGQVAVPKILNNGDFSVSFTGTPEQNYVVESSDSLIPPMTWTSLRTNTTDSFGLVSFTNTPTAPQKFYRVRFDPSAVPPLVYAVENTGANCAAPPLPAFGNLPLIQLLPDPFAWANGSGRSTNFADWKCRRAEIKAQIENYEIGTKPAVDPANIFASYSAGTLTVRVTNIVSGTNRVLTLTCAVSLPAGSGPFPAATRRSRNSRQALPASRPWGQMTSQRPQILQE